MTSEKPSGPIWKVRTIKNYPEAHNHILVGRVLKVTESYIRLHCRTYHYGRMMNKPADVKIGALVIRVVPWSRVEIINELPAEFDYVKSALIATDEGQVFFNDGVHAEPVGSGSRYEVQY
ncbi:MAG: hypothetical protein HQ515_11300 [Phycisphaeraceae bacterium]|nr:hypothetical protein [Phycisphaeraceae bacterium]